MNISEYINSLVENKRESIIIETGSALATHKLIERKKYSRICFKDNK